ncbi:MAG: MauE/DoxX family redox-associated membrane protein [Verrucomicrobiota bacterium]|nr:MauE/DoxX family redox-associated membrane protein [Verrucomicrobiota bacterium]
MKQWLWLILAVLLAAIFAVSGGLKLADPGKFLFDVQAFKLLPYPLAFATALWLPWFEVICAFGLLIPCLRRGAALSLALACVAFIIVLALAHFRGIHLDCGCFGKWLVFPSLGFHIAFNCGLTVGALALFMRKSETK